MSTVHGQKRATTTTTAAAAETVDVKKRKKPSNCCIGVRVLTCSPDTRRRQLLKRHFHGGHLRCDHKHICPVIDLLDGKYDVHYVVSVQYRTTLEDEIRYCALQNKRVSPLRIYRIARQLLLSLHHLHCPSQEEQYAIHLGYMTPQSLCLDDKGDLQLADVGMYRLMTLANHASISSTIIRTNTPHTAPELYAASETSSPSRRDRYRNYGNRLSPHDLLLSRHGSACDVWSFGMILLEYAVGNRLVMKDYDTVYDFVAWCWDCLEEEKKNDYDLDSCDEVDDYDESDDDNDDSDTDNDLSWSDEDDRFTTTDDADDDDSLGSDYDEDEIWETSEEFEAAWERLYKLDHYWLRMILRCLSWNPKYRPSLQELLLELQKRENQKGALQLPESGEQCDPRSEAAESYKLWKEQNMSRGVSVTQYFATRDCIRSTPSIYRYMCPVILSTSMTNAVVGPSDPGPHSIQSSTVQTTNNVMEEEVDHKTVQKRIFFIPTNILKEWCEANNCTGDSNETTKTDNRTLSHSPKKEQWKSDLDPYTVLHSATGELSGKRRQASHYAKLLTSLDTDMALQKDLAVEYRRLLLDYPSSRSAIVRLAQRSGIPGVLRGEVWAAILGVEEDLVAQQLYDSIDTNSTSTCDRQISVDVPRCHQYNLQLSSPEGQTKLTRILKAWVKHHTDENLVYWQGLDSLCAPFLVLNFHFEARAFCCLKGMVQRFVRGFFASDNSAAMERSLALFEKLLLYHDPELARHLHDIGYHPELYAIPWFLTLYAHVLPIEKILRLWDHLLLANDHRTPLYLGIAFMRQMRSTLLHADFNTSVSLLTSMLTDIDIRQAIEEMEFIGQSTPRSLVHPPRGMLLKNTGSGNDKDSSDQSIAKQSSMTITEYRERYLCGRISAEAFEQHLLNVAIVLDTRPEHEYRQRHLAVSDHVGPLDTEREGEDKMDEHEIRQDETMADTEQIGDQPPSWFPGNILSRLRTPVTSPLTPSNASNQIESETRRRRVLRKRIEARALPLVTYKSGLPIVIISSSKQQQMQQESPHEQTEMSHVSNKPDDNGDGDDRDVNGDNPLVIVERLLLRHNIPYVSVVHGGMEEIIARTKIPTVREEEIENKDDESK